MIQDNSWVNSIEESNNSKQQIQPLENRVDVISDSTEDAIYLANATSTDIIFYPSSSVNYDISRSDLIIPTLKLNDDLWASPNSDQNLEMQAEGDNGSSISAEDTEIVQPSSISSFSSNHNIITFPFNLIETSTLWQEEEHVDFDGAMDAVELLDLEAELLVMELAEEQEKEDVSEVVAETTIDKRGRASGWMGSCSVLYIDWSNEELAQQEALKRLGYDRLSISEDTRAFIIQAARTSSITRRQERYYISLLTEAKASLAQLSSEQDDDAQKAFLCVRIAETEKFLVSKMQWAGIKKAPHFLGHGLDIDDLIQSAMLGVIQGVRAYDPTRSSRLLVSVNWHVFALLNRVIANDSRLITLPAYLHEQLGQIKQQSSLLESSLGRLPTKEELAEYLHTSVQRIEDVLRADRKVVSLHEYRKREEAHNGYSFQKVNHALLLDEDTVFQEEVEQTSLRQEIEALLVDLKPREQLVLTMRYDLGDEVGGIRTLEEVGQELHVTRERVRQIEEKAFGKILNKFGLRRVKRIPHYKEKG